MSAGTAFAATASASVKRLFVQRLPRAWETTEQPGPGRWKIAGLIALLIACIYLALIISIDNTNLGTTNGLWKSPQVYAWGHHQSAVIDSGGFLYFPVYGMLTRLIPDAWLRYGVAPPDVTFRKMTVLNALFGAIASGFVWAFAVRLTRSRLAAFVVVLAHAGAAYVLLNSLNSEDIMPAYAFFVGATTLLFEFLADGRLWVGISAAVLLALATLFHWTVMAPALAGCGAVFALLGIRRPVFLGIGAAWLFVFLCATQALVLLAFPALHIPIWAIVLPAKAAAGGWLGLRAEKFFFLIVGVGNYFSGGANVASYRTSFEGASRYSIIVSWIFVILAAGGCAAASLRRRAGMDAICVAVFAAALFLVGEGGNLYSQPQDPQMQVPPMFAAIAGFTLLAAVLQRRRLPLYGFAALLAANAYWNVAIMRASSGADGRGIAAVQELERLFPHQQTVMVCLGFEGWTTWQYILYWHNDTPAFLQRSFHLARSFTMSRGISGKDAAAEMEAQIDRSMAAGLRVVATALWMEPPEQFEATLGTVTGAAEAAEYDRLLRARYRVGQHWQTQSGEIVELLPRP
jgi:hypothetical protein